MPLGAFAPLPLRLGGSDTEGWSVTKHARMCADLVALKRSAPLCVFTFTKSGATVTIHSYFGQNGAGLSYAPDTVAVIGTGNTKFSWSLRSFSDPYDVTYPIYIKHGVASGHSTTYLAGRVVTFANGASVITYNSAGSAADGKATVVLY